MRPDPLSEAAARRHELTRSRAIQALRELDRAGAPVTFASVAQAAGISRSWLYTQPDIRGQIRTLREKTEGTGSAGALPLQAEQQHRHHAVVEQVLADWSDGPLAHLPSGWLVPRQRGLAFPRGHQPQPAACGRIWPASPAPGPAAPRCAAT